MSSRMFRSPAISITTNTKKRFYKDIGLSYDQIDSQSKEKFTEYIKNKFKSIAEPSSTEESDVAEYSIPKHTGSYKNVKAKCKVVESSTFVDLGFKKEYISVQPANVDMKKLINQYDEQSIDELEIQDLLKFDFESIGATKEKLNHLIDKTSMIINSITDNKEEINRRSQVLAFLCDKLNVS